MAWIQFVCSPLSRYLRSRLVVDIFQAWPGRAMRRHLVARSRVHRPKIRVECLRPSRMRTGDSAAPAVYVMLLRTVSMISSGRLLAPGQSRGPSLLLLASAVAERDVDVAAVTATTSSTPWIGRWPFVIRRLRKYARRVGIETLRSWSLSRGSSPSRAGVEDKVVSSGRISRRLSRDAVCLYLSTLSTRFEPKLRREVRPGSRLVSSIPMGSWMPDETPRVFGQDLFSGTFPISERHSRGLFTALFRALAGSPPHARPTKVEYARPSRPRPVPPMCGYRVGSR